MLGHLKPIFCKEHNTVNCQFKNYYCSLCSSIKEQFSLSSTLFVNNEMTFVLSAYDKFIDGKKSIVRCPSSGFTTNKATTSHSSVELAGKFSMILGWLKVVDSSYDNPNILKKFLKRKLNNRLKSTFKGLPTVIQNSIDDYLPSITTTEINFEVLKKKSSNLARNMAYCIGIQTNAIESSINQIADIFYHVGGIILVADHLLDLQKDVQTKQYNPIIYKSISNGSSIALEYDKLYLDYLKTEIQLFSSINHALKQGIIEIDFLSNISSAVNSLKRKIHNTKSEICPNTPFDNNYFFISANDNKGLIFNQVSLCDITDSICECEGCCTCEGMRKTCYGDNCYNACCGGNMFGMNSSGCTCCGYSYWGDFCVGYTNCCDCMCGCEGGEGCCFSSHAWKGLAVIVPLWFISKWIFDNIAISIAIIGIIALILTFRFIKGNKSA